VGETDPEPWSQLPSDIPKGEAPEGGSQSHPRIPIGQRTPNRLDTLLGRAFVDRRKGYPHLSAGEGRAIDLFPDNKVRAIAADLKCTPEALAAELGPWIVRSVRQEGMGSASMKAAYAALEQLEHALLDLPPLADEALGEASRFRFATHRVELLRYIDALVPRVADYISRAKERVKLPRNRPRKEDIYIFINGLIDIYEQLTSKQATCWMRHRNAAPSTPFECFAKAVLDDLFSPKIARELCEERMKPRTTPKVTESND